MPIPNPTAIFRFIHVDNLDIYLEHGGIHSPNATPANGLNYKTIHNLEIQQSPCNEYPMRSWRRHPRLCIVLFRLSLSHAASTTYRKGGGVCGRTGSDHLPGEYRSNCIGERFRVRFLGRARNCQVDGMVR